ncbi:MAG: LacI family DNA-binding transcriptional regulator [Stappiaceae bacterium]
MRTKTKSPTMADVAKLAGVSTMTVSRALKPETSVSRATRERIEKAAEELGYVLDSIASSFSSGRTGFVAVTIPSINNANFADTIKALSDKLAEANLQVILGYTNYDTFQEEHLVEQLLKRRPEAIVVTGGVHTLRCRTLLTNAGIPVVETWDLPDNPIDQVVGFSNSRSSQLMVDHFIECGLSKIGFVGGDNERDNRGHDRYRGFCDTLEKHGLQATRVSFNVQFPFSISQGAAGIRELLNDWPDTEAVMCVSDLIAFGAMTECQRMGLRVPADIAIGGFGAYDLGEFAYPAITTIDVGAAAIGRLTAEKLLNMLANEDSAVDTDGTLETAPRLIVRQSSQPT